MKQMKSAGGLLKVAMFGVGFMAMPVFAAPEIVNVTFNGMIVTADKATAAAGPVTFKVKNDGTIKHMFIVMKTDTPFDKLPLITGKADEAAGEVIGRIDEFASGAKDLTVTLKPGAYILLCNVVGHYMGKMRMAFTVK